MRPGLVLVACGVGLAVLLGSAGLSSAGPTGHGLSASSVTDQTVAAAKPRKRKCRTRACRMANVGQGNDVAGTCGPPQLLDQRVTPGADALRFNTDRFSFLGHLTRPGDLLVAAIMTEGAMITPPAGWQAVPGGDVSSGASQRLQLFYSIPVPLAKQGTLTFGPSEHEFVASAPQTMVGELISVVGVSQDDPLNAAAGTATATPSAAVMAPSIEPSSGTTRLLFIGAASPAPTWTAPAGMRLVADEDHHTHASSGLSIAYQWWRTATATGTRTATISSAAASIGVLVALKFPRVTTCPKLRVLNPRHGKVFQFMASAKGVVRVRVKCTWSKRCVGAVGLVMPSPVAVDSISVPAGRTRTVQLSLCKRSSQSCPLSAVSGQRTRLGVVALVRAPNGQVGIVVSGEGDLKLP
jgi:hypothetical protein